MTFIDTMIKQIIELGIAKPEEISGCTPEEILEIQQRQGITFLPEMYKEFLAKMGKGAGSFLAHLKYFYPELLQLKDDVKAELLQPNLTTFNLPDDAFVFMTNQGYEFFYFHTGDQNEDPVVYHYIEGDGSTLEVKPFKQFEHLTQSWESDIDIYSRYRS